MTEKGLREFINATLQESSDEPDYHVMRCLRKHKQEDMRDVVSRWTMSEPKSAGSLKKSYIDEYGGADYYEIDLKDPSTWGEMTQEDMPPDQFFMDLIKAILADDKRATQRRPY